MAYDLFLLPFLVSVLFTIVTVLLIISVVGKFKFENNRKSSRHIHAKGITRFGGVAVIVAFLLTLLLDKNLVIDKPLFGVLLALLLILIFGVVDDFKQLSWKIQLPFQFLLVVLIFFCGVRLQFMTNPFGGVFFFTETIGLLVGFVISAAWVVFLMNVINWVDGIDGLSGGVSIIGAATIFFLSLRPEINQPPIGIILAAFLGCLLAFLFFNFHPAKILAGTSGAMFMGFVLAVLAIFSGAKIATTLLVLAVPAVDALWVVGERYWAGGSIFSADKRHLHYRLLELGWSQWAITAFYWSITLLIAVIALNTRSKEKFFALLLVALSLGFFLLVIRRKVAKIPKP